MPFRNFLRIIAIVTAIFVFIMPSANIRADESTSTESAAEVDFAALQEVINRQNELQRQIKDLERSLSSEKKKSATLQSQISVLDNQIALTNVSVQQHELELQKLQLEIEQLNFEIKAKQIEVAQQKARIAEVLRALNRYSQQTALETWLSNDTLSGFYNQMKSLQVVESGAKTSLDALMKLEEDMQVKQKNQLAKKEQTEKEQQQLKERRVSLVVQENSKEQLLSDTKSQESRFQQMLAQAKAELDSYSRFTEAAGGSGLLGSQTVCDSWGCYYNQRDSAWGGQSMNETQYTLASDGCLVTSMAMVMTHYGRLITPAIINANPTANYQTSTALLNYTISAAGVSATRETVLSGSGKSDLDKESVIDDVLSDGTPVIVGLNAFGGTHFVVLVSGSDGNYLMRDPYFAGAKDVSFSSHYSVRQIYKVSKVVINS